MPGRGVGRGLGGVCGRPGGDGPLAPLLDLLRHSLLPLDGGDERVEFAVDVLNDERPGDLIRLSVVCGPGDDGEPAITVMLEHEQRHEGGRGDATQKRLSRCPRCGGEIQATVERYYSLRGGVWIESGVDGDNRFYCENDCDLSEYSGRFPELG